MLLGDSKTVATPYASGPAWWERLVQSLVLSVSNVPWVGWRDYNGGVGGQTVATGLAALDAKLATWPADDAGSYKAVLLNWGVNTGDLVADETTWKADYLSIIDKVHAKAPLANVYVMRPWRRGYDARMAVEHGWIDDIVAARAFTYVGPDEAVWLKGADDGATMTSDGVHYSTAGNAECAAQWQTVLGY
jgi:hypothetical protein